MRRSGFTMFEMVVVMLLVVLAAGISVPFVDSMLNPRQVTAATDAVRSSLEAARNRSMEEGRPYRFSVQEGGSSYRIVPDDPDAVTDSKALTIDGDLPEPCLFVSSPAMIDASARSAGGGAWKVVAVFLPDGTARDDAELSFGRPGLLPVTLKLRALTGAISKVAAEATK